MNRVIKLEEVIKLIDKQVEFLKQQNGAGVLLGMLNVSYEQVKIVINRNNETIKELTELRMKVLEL